MQTHHLLIPALGPSTPAQTKNASAAMTKSSNSCVEGMLAVHSEK